MQLNPILLFIKICFLPFIFIGFILPASANTAENTKNTESLITELNSLTENDSQRLALYTQIVTKLWRTNPIEAKYYGEQALALHQRHNQPHQKALLSVYLARVYLDKRDLANAELIINAGVEASKTAEDSRALSLNLFNQAYLYQLQNKQVLALNSYAALAQTYKQLGKNSSLGSVYNNIGNIYFKQGDFDDALTYYQLALPLIDIEKNQQNYANTVMNIGRLFLKLKDYPQAEHNLNLSLQYRSATEGPVGFIETHRNLGHLRLAQQRYTDALTMFDIAEKTALQHNLSGQLIVLQFDKIEVAYKIKDTALMQNSILLLRPQLTPNIQPILIAAGHYFEALYASQIQDWQQAEEHINQLLEFKVYQSEHFAYQNAIKLASKVKQELGKHDEAIELLLSFNKRYQQQQEANRLSLLTQYAQLYKTNDKEREIAELKKLAVEQENQQLKQQQQNRLIIFSFIIIAILLLTYINFVRQRSRNLAKENALANALMEEKKQFFADISHELRTPLTVFKLKLEELEYDIADDPKSTYKLLSDRVNSFNALINDISLLAQHDKGELELRLVSIDIYDFFKRAGEELISLAKEYQLDPKVSICTISNDTAILDATRINQVMANLFSNACRYTTSPGQIYFSVEATETSLIIKIEDSAPGLNKQQQQQIFNRLYRADRSRSRKHGGSGLGLAICRELIEAHQGSIVASDSSLGGITITINIPINKSID